MKKILIVIDYQNDFVSGSLGFEGAEKLDAGICRRIAEYRAAGDEVAFTLDTHASDYLNTQEGRHLPVAHCLKGTEGHSLYGETAKSVREGDRIFEKPAFGSWELAEYLRAGEYDEVELAGLVSNICVLSNAVLAKTALPQAKVSVNSSLTDSFDKKLNAETLDILRGIQVEIIG